MGREYNKFLIVMKKSTSYNYPRPLARQRRPWRLFGLAVCVAVTAFFFLAHDDSLKLAYFSDGVSQTAALSVASLQTRPAADFLPDWQRCVLIDELISKDQKITWGDARLRADGFSLTSGIPNINIDLPDMSDDLAARTLAAEEQPQRPGLLQAILGGRFNFFPQRETPSVLFDSTAGQGPDFPVRPTPLESGGEVPDLGAAVGSWPQSGEQFSGPVIYSENERYTVECNPEGREIFRSVIAKGDTAGVLLNEWLPSAGVLAAVAAAEGIYPLKSVREGRPFSVVRDADSGAFVSFAYEVDKMNRLVIERTESGFVAKKELIEYEIKLAKVSGVIRSSLFETVADCNEGPVLAINLAEVFSCEINFITEIRQGDSFEVVVEKLYRDGEFNGYGKMLAANFTNRGKPYEAFLFTDKDGKFRYYNANGEALQRFLLKAPLSFTRVSSGYSMNRRHPVFGDVRPHQGVDYAAPTGTPVNAVGDGVVTKASWGNGYGNMIIIKHAGGLESQYAHLSGFARGLRAGAKVTQGQTIGYVGSTGTATGPHLDFRLKQGDRWIDPAKAIVPRLDPIGKDRMELFEAQMSIARRYLNEDTALAQYDPQVWGTP